MEHDGTFAHLQVLNQTHLCRKIESTRHDVSNGCPATKLFWLQLLHFLDSVRDSANKCKPDRGGKGSFWYQWQF